jgi:glycosyltransferase involved in cell wall biosynthesis
MALFVEGIRAKGHAVRILALPRGPWVLDKSEEPTVTTRQGWMTADLDRIAAMPLKSVMCFHWAVLPVAVFMGLIYRVPVLYDEHDHYELNTLEGTGSRLRRAVFSFAVRLIHRLCLPWVTVVTCIHLQEQILKKHLEQWQPHVIEIHNYPARAWRETARQMTQSDLLCFVYIGGVYREKGVGAAADAIQALPEAIRSKAELHVFGTGDTQLIADLKTMSGVVVHNGVTPSEFREFAAQHHCVGLSLLANTPRYSLVGTNCTKLFEYLALGMPVIATRVGEFPQTINSNHVGLLVDGELNSIELSQAMQRLVQNKSLYAEMARNAETLMQSPSMTWEHEWDKVCQSGVINSERRAA